MSVFQRHARTLCAELLRIRGTSASPQSSYAQRGVDMQDYFLRYTLDAFAEIGFGYATGSIASGSPSRFGAAFDLVQSRCFKRMDYGIFWPWLAPPDKRFREAVAYMDSVVRECVGQALSRGRQALLAQNQSAPDLLSQALLSMLNPDGTRNASYDEQALRDTCLNFLIAGRDTTALMLSWFFFLLSQHPEVEERVLAELLEVFGDGAGAAAADGAAPPAPPAGAGAETGGSDAQAAGVPSTAGDEAPQGARSFAAAAAAGSAAASASTAASASSPAATSAAAAAPSTPGANADADAAAAAEISFDTLRRLPYLHNSLLESLRLYPPVPFNGFTALEDDTLPGGFFVAKGTYVAYSAYLLHRRADLYPDPERFDPERWERAPPRAFRFVAFHGGPRECLGREMALAEAKVLVATMLLPPRLGGFGIRLRMHPQASVQLKRAIILTARRGIHMQVHLAQELEGLGQGQGEGGVSPPYVSSASSASASAGAAGSAIHAGGSDPTNSDAMPAATSPSVSSPPTSAAGDRWSEEALAAASNTP